MLDPKVGIEERIATIDHFRKKLKTSGYNQNQSMELVTSGVRGYKNKIRNRLKNGEDFYRSAKSTLGGRIQKKLTAKTTWYRKRKSSDIENENETFAGLNANGLHDEPLRKRKRSEDDQTGHNGCQHHHHQTSLKHGSR